MNTICPFCKRILHEGYAWQPITSSSVRIEEAMLVHAVRWQTPELDVRGEISLVINRRFETLGGEWSPGQHCLFMNPTLALMAGFLCEWRIPTTGKLEWLVLTMSEAMKTSMPFAGVWRKL